MLNYFERKSIVVTCVYNTLNLSLCLMLFLPNVFPNYSTTPTVARSNRLIMTFGDTKKRFICKMTMSTVLATTIPFRCYYLQTHSLLNNRQRDLNWHILHRSKYNIFFKQNC